MLFTLVVNEEPFEMNGIGLHRGLVSNSGDVKRLRL